MSANVLGRWMSVIVGLVAIGCGSSDEPAETDAGAIDATPADDAQFPECQSPEEPGTQDCDPVALTGCGPCEKCAQLADDTSPSGVRIGCVYCGINRETCAVPEGGVCVIGSNTDNCAPGLHCFNSRCRPICEQSPSDVSIDTCDETSACFSGDGLDGVELPGLCQKNQCDPVSQLDCFAADAACYFQLSNESVCASVPPQAVGLRQDDKCFGPDPDSVGCFGNGCDKGHSPVLFDPNDFSLVRCGFHCRPVPTYRDAVGNLVGSPAGDGSDVTCESTFGDRPDGPGAPYQCRFLNSVYLKVIPFIDPLEAPESVGVCVHPNEFGDCSTFDYQACLADPNCGDNVGGAAYVSGCVPDSDPLYQNATAAKRKRLLELDRMLGVLRLGGR